MKKVYPGIYNIFKITGLKNKDRVLILRDSRSNKKAIGILEAQLRKKCLAVRAENLPLKLQPDFPLRIRNIIREFDLIILAASQSWYQAPARRLAKHKYKKRIVECYNLSKEMLENGALCADYSKVEKFTLNFGKVFKPGTILTLRTEKGADFSATIRNVFRETGNYKKNGSGGNLPAGEISLGIEKNSANGRIIFDISCDMLGRLEKKPLEVYVKKGKAVSARGYYKNILKRLFKKDKRLRNIAEIGFGTNKYAILGRSVLEDEKKFGTAHIGFGNDTYFGGSITGAHWDAVFLKPEITLERK